MCLENINSEAFEQRAATSKKPRTTYSITCIDILVYSLCVVQVPDPPPHRWRRPLDLERAEVYCHLKAVYHLNRQTLQHHHHCRLPEEADIQRDTKRMNIWDLITDQFWPCCDSDLSLTILYLSFLTISRFYSTVIMQWSCTYNIMPCTISSGN